MSRMAVRTSHGSLVDDRLQRSDDNAESAAKLMTAFLRPSRMYVHSHQVLIPMLQRRRSCFHDPGTR
jgi:hypothetical protein